MSKNVAMFVDVANMYYAARGQDVDVDYVALLKHATKGRDLIRAYAYTGLDPENENQRKFIDFLGKNGYKPVIKDIRKFGDGRMKANLDIELVVDLFRLADRMDIAVIVSGDGDFAPAIKALQDKGVRCEVISFKPNTSSDLVAVADEFMDIMKIASISRKEGRALRDSMSAPEMPAKEVSPEFGFREASPSVAAAALAAIKGGPSDTARRGRASTRRTASTPAKEEPKAVASATATADAPSDADPERKRRRRRGGRGRGRSRRDDEAGASEATAGEPGWEEFDDLSQIDGGSPDREYTFQEVDAATLAELGLSESELAELQAAAPHPSRRHRGRAEAGSSPFDPDQEGRCRTRPTPVPRAKPSRSRLVAARPGPRRTTPVPRAKPSRSRLVAVRRGPRRTTPHPPTPVPRAKPSRSRPVVVRRGPRRTMPHRAAQSEGGADGEPQGIWGRFRSARKPRAGE